MTGNPHRRPVPDRARKRAIRAHAARMGVSYSIAARQLAAMIVTGPHFATSEHPPSEGIAGEGMASESLASEGRTIYPAGTDAHRQWLIETRAQWPFDTRVRDTRGAADLPMGRALHLARRFPVMRGEPGTGVGPLYGGECREAAIAMLYATVAHEDPGLVPTADELAWAAELGEETAVDITCAGLDRAVRVLLDADRWALWTRTEAALTVARTNLDRRVRDNATQLAIALRTVHLRASMEGARHTLDALLMVADDGHAPGSRVRILLPPHEGRLATIVGARWDSAGPPDRYEVRPDADSTTLVLRPDSLALTATAEQSHQDTGSVPIGT